MNTSHCYLFKYRDSFEEFNSELYKILFANANTVGVADTIPDEDHSYSAHRFTSTMLLRVKFFCSESSFTALTCIRILMMSGR